MMSSSALKNLQMTVDEISFQLEAERIFQKDINFSHNKVLPKSGVVFFNKMKTKMAICEN